MQKILNRLSTLNMFQYWGINEYYMVFKLFENGVPYWHYEWHNRDMIPQTSEKFYSIEDLIKTFAEMEKKVLGDSYTEEEAMKVVLTKIARREEKPVRDWLLCVRE